MNKAGNQRSKSTQDAIEKAVFILLKRQGYDAFSVRDVCTEAGINRSSFYAHYQDINDLMIKIESNLVQRVQETLINPISANKTNYFEDYFINFFNFVKEYKVFYRAFLKTGNPSFSAPNLLSKSKDQLKKLSQAKGFNYTDEEIDFHLHYFGGGLKAVTALWIQYDCKQTPEQMAKIIHDEYANNTKYF